MAVVVIDWWEGRTVEQKRELARVITDAMVEIGHVHREGLHIVFHDVPRSAWARAGVMGSDRTDP